MVMDEALLKQALEFGKPYTGKGEVASYIPELSKADGRELGICVRTIGGEEYRCGHWQRRFTIQSISKVINLAMALEHYGFDAVFHKTKMEPSGASFNAMSRISDNEDIPFNPLVNSGAIAIVELLLPLGLDHMLSTVRGLCGDKYITLDEDVFKSEWTHSARNRSLAYLLQSKGLIDGNVDETLLLYTQLCSLSVTAESLSNLGQVLANGGVQPETGRRLLKEEVVRTTLTMMLTCGMYDGSGEFAVRVGLPSKSGVGGGILSVVPGEMGIGVYGPSLDSKGNSVAGQKVLEYISRTEKLHIMDRFVRHTVPVAQN
ncbi:glutaminase A [Flintibacter muris]|uniref:glutaminase A n=1 Tax=Flintibacter muris TaxID=2941327 RepID=UPI0030BA0381